MRDGLLTHEARRNTRSLNKEWNVCNFLIDCWTFAIKAVGL